MFAGVPPDRTPSGLTITPRDLRFGRGERQQHWWNGGNPYGTALYNALSATFPRGETFFVESVKACREGAPPKLAEQIRAFVAQEVMHSREHIAFNKRANEAGYDLTPLEQRVEWRLSLARERPPVVSLAVTMALEHFTAMLAHQLLEEPRHLANCDPETRALWQWHAIEEIEHKGVAYDTWLYATGHWPRFLRWKVKAKVMLLVTRNFVIDRSLGAIELLRQDGITGPKAWARLAWFAFGRPGMMRKALGAWAAYFMPGFHPWNVDDRALIARAERELAPEELAPVPA